MARKIEWTIRVINHGGDGPKEAVDNNRLRGLWVEQLRYMGYAKELASFDNPQRQVLEFYAPSKGLDYSKTWADMNASRMRSFGIDAVAAPKWETDRNDVPRGSMVDPPGHLERLNRPRVTP